MHDDLSATRDALRTGRLSAPAALEQSLAATHSPACRHAFVRLFDAALPAQAERMPLRGLAVSIKDLFDVAGYTTSAGSRVLLERAVAQQDSLAVARLRAAGATLLGHTNMTEFAYSGLGLNPHHGTPLNPVTRKIDGLERIPGGSSSGAAVSVAAGAAWAALGSDTGGSIRIPAALQGLVGFKNTQMLTPRQGMLALSDSLDTACAITHSVRDAVLIHEILAARRVELAGKPLNAQRLAVAKPLLQDGMDAAVAAAFERTLTALSAAGAQIEEIDLAPLAALPANGIVVAAEAWSWFRHFSAAQQAQVDPRVARRMRGAEAVLAADYIERLQQRQGFITAMEQALRGFDAVLSPTVPVVAPELAPLLASDEAYFAANGLLLRNPSVVNALDGCAISLPCQAPGELPVGLMLWSTAGRDDALLDTALCIEEVLKAL